MSDLRLILLVLGVLLIIGIYCWEVFFRSEQKRKDNILDAIDDMPDLPSMDMKQQDEAVDYSRSLLDLGNMIAQSRRETDIPEQSASVFTRQQQVVEQSAAAAESIKPDTPQDPAADTVLLSNAEADDEEDDKTFTGVDFDLFNKSEQPEPELSAAAPDADELPAMPVQDGTDTDTETTEQETAAELESDEHIDEPPAEDIEQERQLGKAGDDLIVLYITSPAQTLFNGLTISKAAEEVGMVYGHMNVFHHFGPGKLHSGQPLFSMANMFEPGSFDLGRMADLKTKGVVLFMYPPASIEPKVVFELFLNTVQRLAESLNGELRTQDNKILNSGTIQSMRMQAESLSDMQ